MDELMRRQGWATLTPAERTKLPNFFVIGAMKAGTTSLYEYLRRHPQVFMTHVKEPHYFTGAGRPFYSVHPQMARTLEDYLSLFVSVSGERAIGEASPSYLPFPEAPHRIRDVLPESKIVAILRDPVDRAFSSYSHRRARRLESARSFGEAVAMELAGNPDGDGDRDHVAYGFYGRQLAVYFELFDRSQVHVILQEDLARDPSRAIHDLYAFVGVDPTFNPGETKVYNAGTVPVKSARLQRMTAGRSRATPALNRVLPTPVRRRLWAAVDMRNRVADPCPQDVRTMLNEIYREDVRLLQGIIERDLDSWLS